MEMQATDLSARLLATENLTVVRANAPTASFDIKSRVLTLPMWKEMTPEIEDMLVGHEVGHALYTLDKYIEPIQEQPKLRSYMNILEDVRIEKLIKRKYPGLRKRMNEGYKQLNERDFFGVSKVPSLDVLNLIDRINLYFKAGFQCGVKFSADEKEFVNRAERTETIEEVIQLAHDIYAYAKEQAEKRKQERVEAGELSIEDDEPIFVDFDLDVDSDDWGQEETDKEENEPEKHSTGHGAGSDTTEEELESSTERAFQERLEELADQTTEYRYHKIEPLPYEVVVGYKKILSETKPYWYSDDSSDEEKSQVIKQCNSDYESFKNETMRAVNYLVKEFEMRKSAQLYKRAQISKVGSLDMKKIYAYKLQDDLFKRVTTLPQGKNHGMVMLLDWSGSMDGVIEDTLKQVINLAMFCNRIQIPYRVLAFTTQYHERRDDSTVAHDRYTKLQEFNRAKYTKQEGKNILSNTRDHFTLLELFSNKMTTSEFHSMAKRVIDSRFHWNDGYSMGGTPLNEALAWVYLNIDSYIKQNSIEKMTLITLTDGEGSQLTSVTRGRLCESRNETVNGVWKRIKQRHFIKDEVTQKTYEIRDNSTVQTEVILRMIKDRYNVSTVGFYICRNHRRDLHSVINANIPNYNGSVESLIDEWRKSFRQDSFASIKNTGRDELFLIPQTATKIEEGELDVRADAKAQSIAKNFSKYLNVKKTSRILLNRFVTLVA